MSTRRDPASFPNAVLIEACDIPAGMTIAEWRTQKRSTASRTRARRRRRRALQARRAE